MKRVTIGSTLLTIAIVCFFILLFGDDDCDACYTSGGMAVKTIICGAVIIVWSIYDTIRYKKTESLVFDIQNQPLLETHEASAGVSFAAEGTIVADSTIESLYTKTECVYSHSILEKYVRQGKSGQWVRVENTVASVPFYLADRHGRLAIDISRIDDDKSGRPVVEGEDPKRAGEKQHWSELDAVATLTNSTYKEKTGRWSSVQFRKSEYVLKPGTSVFVYGYVEDNNGTPILREHDQHPLIISRKSHKAFIKEFYVAKNLIYLAHLLAFIGFATIVLALAYWQIAPFRVHLAIVLIGAIILLGSVVFTMYNRMILLRNRARNAWSNLEGELKRRFDLIPRLIDSVRGYTQHEATVQNMLTILRSELSPETQHTHTELHKKLSVVAEAYPDVKAAPTIGKLMQNLTDCEERIAYCREFYNNAVQNYNTVTQQFPFFCIAHLFRFEPMPFFEATKQETAPVDKKFRSIDSNS